MRLTRWAVASSRPRWHLGHGANCRVAEVEDFFVDGLERWRKAMNLEQMVLCHSLGYIAVASQSGIRSASNGSS